MTSFGNLAWQPDRRGISACDTKGTNLRERCEVDSTRIGFRFDKRSQLSDSNYNW